MCHHRIDETEVDQSLEEFIRKGFMRSMIVTKMFIKDSFLITAHKQQKLLAQAESFCIAWNNVKNELPSLSKNATYVIDYAVYFV